MRAIWTGSIAFGLVNVPVKAYGATSDHDVSLHQVHDADGGRIRYQRSCEVCGKKIPYERINKAFDDGERTVVLTDEEMESLPAEKSREIEVVQFVPSEQIDPIMLERSYYLVPDSKSPKAYALLRRTLEETDLTAVVKFALRQKTRLGAMRVRGDVLVLQGLLWADEVREADFPEARTNSKISAQELKMSATLVKEYSTDFSPGEFEDDYQVQLRTLIEEKLKKGDSLDTEETFGATGTDAETTESGDVIDLLEALKRSIARKSGSAKPDTPARRSGDAAKEATPKKTPAKKTAAAKKKPAATTTETSAKAGTAGRKTASKSRKGA
ncbi:Ku protein [Paeniglutamicibacter sp. ABSL32-1]|uniref:non-homologous end joining protein Ku n=1 Tax=Paeniglutamicibacter quisquiliarum TaxID=2849498 RepID=UPI001C2D4534|nr:Ku protein [Paeniglutamicibacter quisquiliarum]MBV1780819.1 Ku protein [Paeniglutamicibacter quisquiliarum]